MHTDKSSRIHRLWKKPAAAIASGVIILTMIVALFAYQIAPDSSPMANRMIIELGAKAPGFSKQVLRVPKTSNHLSENSEYSLWQGKADAYYYIPINRYWADERYFYVEHFIDDGIQDTLSYSYSSLFPGEKLQNDKHSLLKKAEEERLQKKTFWLGTDRYGRDILSRLLIGSRVSLSVGLIAVLLSLSLGILLGTIAGYYGSWIDNTVMFVINIFWSIPTLLLVFAITLTIGKGFWEIFVAIGLTMWVGAARLIRGQVMAIKETEFIQAAKALGANDLRIMFKHILPNIIGPIIVIAASNFATAILIEAGLSFLGIGIQPPQPSWGLMIKEHYNFIVTNKPFAALIPGLAIMLLVYAFNILGNGLRDIFDVRSQ